MLSGLRFDETVPYKEPWFQGSASYPLGCLQAGDRALDDLIHIVDDDPHFRSAIARLLKLRGYSVAEYGSAEHFLEQMERTNAACGCILLDVSMPGLTGPELQTRLSKIGSPLPVIFVTGHGDVPTTVRAMKAGAEDVLTKPVSERSLVDSIKSALAHFQSERAQRAWRNDAQTRLDSLTPRERQVFEYVVRGKLNKQAAYDLGIAERTIKAHRQRLFEKLGARTVADLVSFAEKLGILD